jgi:hypothetical protein
MFEPCELHPGRTRFLLKECFDFNNRRNRVACVPEELQAHGADVLRHLVEQPTRRGDDAIATFFLHTG